MSKISIEIEVEEAALAKAFADMERRRLNDGRDAWYDSLLKGSRRETEFWIARFETLARALHVLQKVDRDRVRDEYRATKAAR